MKIVIDIPEHTYNNACVLADLDGAPILKAIKNGIPLDNIKAEIEKEKVCKIKGYNAIGSKSEKGFDMGLLRAFEILDKHISGKERMNETNE